MSQLFQAFQDLVESNPTATCLIEGDHILSRQAVLNEAITVRGYLTSLGIHAGDAVAVMVYNQSEFLTTVLGIRALGAVAVPINIQMLPQDIAYVLQHAEVKHLFVVEDLAPRVAPLGLLMTLVAEKSEPLTFLETLGVSQESSFQPSDETPETLAFLMYTSGTTGSPKGVMLTEANLMSNIDGILQRIAFSAEERVVMALPLFHSYGFIISLAALLNGAPLILVPKFQPRTILQQLMTHQATILPLVPTFFTLFLDILQKHPELKLDSLKLCVSGGAALPEALLRRIEQQLNVTILEGYGLTETSPVVAVNCPKLGSRAGTVGQPLSNVDVTIFADAEIGVKGPNVMLGYYKDAVATAEALDAEGWLLFCRRYDTRIG